VYHWIFTPFAGHGERERQKDIGVLGMQITLEPTGATYVTEAKWRLQEWIGRTATGHPITVLVYAISPRGERPAELADALNTIHPWEA
jgi:hypothetical protein